MRPEDLLAREWSRRELLAGAGVMAASALVLPGCGGGSSAGESSDETVAGKPRRGGVLTFAAAASTVKEKLDPALSTGPTGYLRSAAVFDTLVSVTRGSWEVEPLLAESWEPNADLTEWQFKLRRGVTFHDGRPLTSKDVVWSLRRVLDEKLGSGAYTRFSLTMTAAGIRTVDASTIAIKTKRPDALLPYAFAEPGSAIVRDGQTAFSDKTMIGTGPYRFVSFKPGVAMELERNPDYWDPELPYLDGIRRVDAPEPAAAGQGVISGDFDVAAAVSYAAAKQLGEKAGTQVIALPGITSFILVMDATQAPFQDKRVRTAFKLAMDREAVLNTVFAGYGATTGDLMLRADDRYYPDGLGVPEYDPERAKRLLKAAGHADGVDIDVWGYGEYSPIAVAFADRAKPAGIRASFREGNPDTYFDDIYLKSRFYASDWQEFFPGDLLWYAYGTKATYNESRLKLPEIDDLYDKALRTTDVDKQRTFIKQGLALAARNMGHIIPVMGDQLLLAKQNVKGIVGAPAYKYDLRRAYLES